MVACSSSCQAIWLHELLQEIFGSELQAVVIKIENTSAIALVKNLVFHCLSKYIKSCYHYIRERIEENEIIVEHVNGKEQRVYILTKALAKIKFVEMHKLLGVEGHSISI